jgi:hypothetical protein
MADQVGHDENGKLVMTHVIPGLTGNLKKGGPNGSPF